MEAPRPRHRIFLFGCTGNLLLSVDGKKSFKKLTSVKNYGSHAHYVQLANFTNAHKQLLDKFTVCTCPKDSSRKKGGGGEMAVMKREHES